MQRSRNPLGEIGNRVQQQKNCRNGKLLAGKTVAEKKRKVMDSNMSKPVVKTASFAAPAKGAATAAGARAGVMAGTLQRTNSTAAATSSTQAFPTLKDFASNLRNARAKLQPQPNRGLGLSKSKPPRAATTASGATSSSATMSNEVETPRLQQFIAVESTSNWHVDLKTLEKSQGDKAIVELAEAFSLQRFDVPEIPDIDAADTGVGTVKDYVKEISVYMFRLEKKFPITEKYLNGRLINGRMRAVLMDWLVEVHGQFKYSAETLFMAAKTLDRYLQLDSKVVRTQLQLVGMTALFVSAKFEEVMTPNIIDFSAVSDNAFSVEELRRMEEKMLKAIGFDLSAPQPIFFLRRFAKAAQAQFKLYQLAKFVMELTLIDYEVIHLLPSRAAAGSLALATMILEKKSLPVAWTATLVHYSNCSLSELKPILKLLAGALARTYEDPNKLQAVINKYARGRVLRISKIPEVQDIKSWKPRVEKELA